MSGLHTLIALRHAKSSWDDDVDDHDRPLSARGRRDAEAVGRTLAQLSLQPGLVLCSTAKRTRQTWDGAASGVAAGQVRYLPEIYRAWVPELVGLVRAVPEDIDTLLLLGHAPGIPDLVEHVCARTGSPAWAHLDSKFATSGLAVVSVQGPWHELGHGRAVLSSFSVPRG